MARVVDLTWIGDKKLASQINTLLDGKQRRKLIMTTARAVAKPIRDRAAELAPVDTGALRRGLKVRAAKGGREAMGIDVVSGKIKIKQADGTKVEQDTFYGIFVEFGTRHMSAQPYLRPAMDQLRESSIRKWEQLLGQGFAAALKASK